MNRTNVRLWTALGVGFFCLGAWASSSQGEIAFEPSWEIPTYSSIRQDVSEWIDQQQVSSNEATLAYSMWPNADLRSTSGPELLHRVIETFGTVEPRVEDLLKVCNSEGALLAPPDLDWLEDPTLTDLERKNLKLYFGRWLTQQGYYDEAIKMLVDLTADEVVDPASLFFYRAIALHQVVEPEKARVELTRLLEREAELPQRFHQIAVMLDKDLSGLRDESLDHIARRMNDVRRRLDIGRAGKQVQVVEDGVLDSLEKLIEALEKQQQQQQQSSSSGGAQQSNQPMQDSMLPGMKADMQVDEKDIGNSSGWGDLPAKEREEALQEIGRDFPAHYRDIIEQYFRELADESRE